MASHVSLFSAAPALFVASMPDSPAPAYAQENGMLRLIVLRGTGGGEGAAGRVGQEAGVR